MQSIKQILAECLEKESRPAEITDWPTFGSIEQRRCTICAVTGALLGAILGLLIAIVLISL